MPDGIAIGEQAYRKLTDAWLSAANDVFAMAGDKHALREFRAAFGRNPAHIRKAVERFPEVWDPNQQSDLFQLLGTIQLSKVKSDLLAAELFDNWNADVDRNYDDLKEAIDEANSNGKPHAKKCKRCQRLDEYLSHRDFVHVAELKAVIDK